MQARTGRQPGVTEGMNTLKALLSSVGSHFLAFCARTFSGKVVLAAAAGGLIVGALLF